jgi:NAD(P)-dependent dehydrogenase (short-subunit alcohol dehydrogenase family)
MYATTKRGVGYFAKSIAKEYRASPLVIGLVSPGGYSLADTRKIPA